MNLALLTILLAFVPAAFAFAQTPEALFARTYSTAKWDDQGLGPALDFNGCDENVLQLAREFQEAGVLSSDFKRVTFRLRGSKWNMEDMMTVFNARTQLDKNGHRELKFRYHAVGLSGGKVYDFSFDVVPRVLRLEDYLAEMFLPKTAFMPYGPHFRSRYIQDPTYTVAEALEELRRFEVTVEPIGVDGRIAGKSVMTMEAFTSAEACVGLFTRR